MMLDRIFFGYMAAVARPSVRSGAAGAGFLDQAVFLDPDRGRGVRRRLLSLLEERADTMIGMPARLLGFVIGIALMVAITAFAGTDVRFF
jgi:hypothetical protein